MCSARALLGDPMLLRALLRLGERERLGDDNRLREDDRLRERERFREDRCFSSRRESRSAFPPARSAACLNQAFTMSSTSLSLVDE